MSPKFRGNSDDWLDDQQNGSRGQIKKKGSHARAEALPPEQANALVAEVFPKLCRVILDETGEELLCGFRRAGVTKDEEVRERTFVTVGDRVKADVAQSVVEGVCERRNRLLRPAPGKEGKKVYHVIAANLDRVVIVVSTQEPEFSPGLVDRFLVATQAAGIDALVCVTKIDLHAAATSKAWDLYLQLGVELIEVSSKTETGISELRNRLEGQTVLFCGQSGVGKTSLLRLLLGQEVGRVGEVSGYTGKGRHTTTSTVLLGGPSDSRWIDSPGVREFGLAEIEPADLARYFPEVSGIPCATAGCTHSGEPACAAVSLPRHASYLRILESLRAGEN